MFTQAVPTLQQYEILVIQKVAQVLNVQKIKLPIRLFGLGGGFFFFLLLIFFPLVAVSLVDWSKN